MHAIRPRTKLVGTAETLRFLPNREDLFWSHGGGYNAQKCAFDAVAPGEVIVIEARSERGSGALGDVLALHVVARRAAGIVTDCGVRDCTAVAEIGIPVFSQGGHPAVHHRTCHHRRGHLAPQHRRRLRSQDLRYVGDRRDRGRVDQPTNVQRPRQGPVRRTTLAKYLKSGGGSGFSRCPRLTIRHVSYRYRRRRRSDGLLNNGFGIGSRCCCTKRIESAGDPERDDGPTGSGPKTGNHRSEADHRDDRQASEGQQSGHLPVVAQ
ncbi:hypothetical protein ACFV24_03005 [Nocardia fluminea]|uniref:RraA family protein n=1 Tax=Nocardia fluminea TaxID=134984 RepID=UPI00366AF43E